MRVNIYEDKQKTLTELCNISKRSPTSLVNNLMELLEEMSQTQEAKNYNEILERLKRRR